MSRRSREELNASFFHVMCQGINKEMIFANDMLKRKYLALMKKYINDVDLDIICYCIMSNHTHILIHTESIAQMSKYMKCINTEFAQFYNWKMERVGFVFRDRFKSQPIYDEKYLFQCINYIHKNPVKAKIVKKCSDYEYSSYNNFSRNIFLRESPFLEHFFGKTDITQIESVDVCNDFLDVEYDKDYVMEEYIMKFCQSKKMSLEEVLNEKDKRNDLIRLLLKSEFICKKDIQKKLNISYWKVVRAAEENM
ncbi:MAG: transposase [Clostridia bacterium]|nr:transposase [Clostridia bacterium]